MFSYNPKKDLYYAKRGGKQYYARDPKDLFDKLERIENQAEKPPPTFREIAEEWQKEKWEQISENTKQCYNAYYDRLVQDLGEYPIADLSACDFQRIILRMKDEGYAAKTVMTTRTVANMIMNYAITRDPPLIRYNPVSAVSVPRGLPKTKRSAPETDVQRLINENVRSARFGLFPFLLVYSGLRRGEALALTWGDIDFEEKSINVEKSIIFPHSKPELAAPKTAAGIRRVPLFPQLEKELLHVTPNHPKDTDLIFGMPHGNKPMTLFTFEKSWREWAQDVGLASDMPTHAKGKNGRMYTTHHWKASVTPHQLRHLFVTLCFEAGVDAETTKEWAGHTDIQTTLQIYTDLRKKHETTQREKMIRYLSQVPEEGH